MHDNKKTSWSRSIALFTLGIGMLGSAIIMVPRPPIAIYRSASAGSIAAIPPPAAPEKMAMNCHALVIGIDNYSKGWDNLKTARQDAEAVADVLEKKYGFSVERLLDGKATRADMIATLDSLVSYTDQDNLLIYYAGHGFYDETISEGYWIPSDARKDDRGRYTKEDWIWNSTVTKILGACKARHILVIADACYGGSLFRGGEEILPGNEKWYVKVYSKPSRSLITSGDMEPVLDSGSGHSIFAGELLEYLNDPPQPIFSASELGLTLRQKVGQLTRQTVRMGPLPVASDEGGEFIFASDIGMLTALSTAPEAPIDVTATWKGDKQKSLQDAVLLASQGASRSAENVAAQLKQSYPTDPVVQNLSSQLDEGEHLERGETLHRLIDELKEYKQTTTNAPDITKRQPILASIFLSGSDASDQVGLTLLCNTLLDGELEKEKQITLVERASLDEILQELHLSTTGLAQEELRLTVGKLLPASILLLGNVNDSHIFVRLVNTETSQILASFVEPFSNENKMLSACQTLGSNIVAKITQTLK